MTNEQAIKTIEDADPNLASRYLESAVTALKQKEELLKYLRLPKFDPPNAWVNVNDILERLRP